MAKDSFLGQLSADANDRMFLVSLYLGEHGPNPVLEASVCSRKGELRSRCGENRLQVEGPLDPLDILFCLIRPAYLLRLPLPGQVCQRVSYRGKAGDKAMVIFHQPQESSYLGMVCHWPGCCLDGCLDGWVLFGWLDGFCGWMRPLLTR